MNWKLGLIVAIVVAAGGLAAGAFLGALTSVVLLAIAAIAVLAAFVAAAVFRMRASADSTGPGPSS